MNYRKGFTFSCRYELRMFDDIPVMKITLEQSAAVNIIVVILSLFAFLVAVLTFTHDIMLFSVPSFILIMILGNAFPFLIYVFADKNEFLIYHDRFQVNLKLFGKKVIEFSEIFDIKAVYQGRFKIKKIEFEMINVDDVKLSFLQIEQEKFDDLVYNIESAWKRSKGSYDDGYSRW